MSANLAENTDNSTDETTADLKLRGLCANELIFALVGPVGSGTSEIALTLSGILSGTDYGIDPHVIKASDVITVSPPHDTKLKRILGLQNAGDEMRKKDQAALAVKLISKIKEKRDDLDCRSESTIPLSSVNINNNKVKIKRAYIIDSLKHPAEVELLRAVYKEAFCLIGVVCEEDIREKRLSKEKLRASSLDEVTDLMKRDEDSDLPYGQKVADTFHLADFFVSNSINRFSGDDKTTSNPLWDVPEQIVRLVDLLTFRKIIRPTPSESGMFHAYGAKLRSACLSRQVGAALLDSNGNVVSTGTNEVPRAGGGVYGGRFSDANPKKPAPDHRCANHQKNCSNTKTQKEIINTIINQVPALKDVQDNEEIAAQLKKTQIGRLLEYSRAVHAEMDALISAGRTGASTIGTRLFVTTFPCHYCARHIVSAGVDEVQYIEPYPKSKALDLHGDAITRSSEEWVPPSSLLESGDSERDAKVLFRAFTGVAPRLYRQAFFKDRALKNNIGDLAIGEADYASGLLRLNYRDIEDSLLNLKTEGG